MANQIPSFLSGAKCTIKVGNEVVAFAQSLTFSDDMQVQPVGQLGKYQNLALEPTGYLARGSVTLTHYSDHVIKAFQGIPDIANQVGDNTSFPGGGTQRDGNSLLVKEFFSPAAMFISRDFDIEVWEKTLDEIAAGSSELNPSPTGTLMYIIQGCRFTNYGISFSPGQLVNENLSFIARGVLDARAGTL